MKLYRGFNPNRVGSFLSRPEVIKRLEIQQQETYIQILRSKGLKTLNEEQALNRLIEELTKSELNEVNTNK